MSQPDYKALDIPRIFLISYKKKLFDVPDARKVHKTPIPQLSGLSFFPATRIAIALNVDLRYLFSADGGFIVTQTASSVLIMSIVDDAVAPVLMGLLGERNMAVGFMVPLLGFIVIAAYSFWYMNKTK